MNPIKSFCRNAYVAIVAFVTVISMAISFVGCDGFSEDIGGYSDPVDGGGAVEKPSDKDDSSTDEKDEYDGLRVLTYENMGRLSKGKNVVFFLVDRFDAKYYAQKLEQDSDFFDGLDGFTYFNDYTSLYCRTYPGVASILTGKDHDYFVSKNTAFNNFFGDGGKLGVLK